mgnify:CR=1 FL=1
MELHLSKKSAAKPGEEQPSRGMFASKRALTAWTGFAAITISAAAFFLVVYPQWNRVGIGREFDTAALEQTYGEREESLNKIKQLRENYDEIDQSQIALLSTILPQDKAVPELLDQLEAIARQSGVSITDISISEVSESGPSARQSLQAEVSAATPARRGNTKVKSMNIQIQATLNDYQSFKQLLEQMQSHTRLLDVESYLFATDQEIQTLTVKAYYLPLE